MHSFNATTGAPLWTFYTGASGYETPYGEWPLLHIDVVADGKLYVMGGHTYSPPLFRGSNLWCLNASTGQPIWTIFNFPITNGAACALADGYLVEPNAYDNQLYAYGKGQSATTVTAPDVAIPLGKSVVIKGTVTDQSPGQTSQGIPAAGTPAISDDSMTAWMQYLYMQQPKPTNATGVKVHLTATDPNGNFQDIGYVTSDVSGMFKKMWAPPVQGEYTITASFDGSNSYFASSAETAIGVEVAVSAAVVTPAPTQTATPTTSAPVQTASPSPSANVVPPTSATPTTTYVAIAAAVIVIVAVAAVLIFRRRK